MKVKAKSSLITLAVNTALSLIERLFIDKIPNEDVRIGLKASLNPLRGMVLALGDENPRDGDQILEIWKNFVGGAGADFIDTTLAKHIQLIDNEHLRRGLSSFSLPVVNMLRLVTDENPNNAEQLEKLWLDFLRSPDTHDVVLEDLLGPALNSILDEATASFVLQFLESIFDKISNSDESESVRERALRIKRSISKHHNDEKMLIAA